MKIRYFTLPNILTLMNLLCGSLAVVGMMTLEGPMALRAAFLLMLASALFDFLDGFAARLLKQYSQLGVQLDSLADMVSFGLLPSLIAIRIYFEVGGSGWWAAIPLSIAAFSALRLARFNVDDDQKNEFRGLPTPANALLIGSCGWYVALSGQQVFGSWVPWAVLGACAVLSWLLVSPVRMFSLKFEGFGFRRNAVRYVFLLISLVFILIFGLSGIGPATILYLLASIIMWAATPRETGK